MDYCLWLAYAVLYLLLGLFIVIPIEAADLRGRHPSSLTNQEACTLVWLWLGWPLAAALLALVTVVMAVCALLDLIPVPILRPTIYLGQQLHRLAYQIANRGRP